MKPLGNKVLIQPDSPSEVTQGGIILTQAKKADTGLVLKVSEDQEFQVKEGDRVRFVLGQGIEVEGLLLIEEHNILYVL